MKQFDKIIIKTNLSSNPYLLLSIWLFLILMPYFVLSAYVNRFLTDSEKRILTKTKYELINEINEFRRALSSEFYINNKLSSFSLKNDSKKYNALSLKEEIEKITKAKVSALFYFNKNNNFFDSYVNKDYVKELGMFSKYSMKNLLLTFLTPNKDASNKERYNIYFNNLLMAAGGINLIPETATPVLSGKSNLGKMIAYYKVFNNNTEQELFLCLFKVKDIYLKNIIKNAEELNNNHFFIRKIINSKFLIKEKSNQDKLDPKFMRFQQSDSGDLSVFSKTSDEMILRLVTADTYYPFYLTNIIENEPILKITAPKSYLTHPIRRVINKLTFPTIILMLFISVIFIRIAFFGYVANFNIIGRLLFCIALVVLLPFASYFISASYNQHFEEEYAENEIQQYTNIQTEIINKTVDSYINNQELSIAKMRKKINGLSSNELNDLLFKTLESSDASLISYNYKGEEEKIISLKNNDSLSKLGKDGKSLIDICIKHYLSKFDSKKLDNLNSLNDLKIGDIIEPHQIELVLTNLGKIWPSVSNEPDAVYCVFPIFENEKIAKSTIGSVLIKFDTYRIVKKMKNNNPILFEPVHIDNYLIRNAVIPVNKNGELPDEDKMTLSDGFDYKKIIDRINQCLIVKSQESWKTEKSINTIKYLDSINALAISTAEKLDIKANDSLDIKNIIFYIVFMVLILSFILSVVIVVPIRKLQKASGKIASGDYTNKIRWESGDELEKLCQAFNGMTDALAQKEKMSSYVSKEVIDEVSSNNEYQLQPGGERIPVAVLFCALKGKKDLDSYSPEEVTRIISRLIDAVDEISTSFHGQIDKLIEDTVMVVFRDIGEKENITLNACKAALEINKRLEKELPDFKINMGIASGEAVSGKIGSRNGKLDYTVIGNPVNLAARLKVQAYKAKNTGILICPNSIRKLHGVGRLNYIERMTIKGRTNRTFPLYELLELRK